MVLCNLVITIIQILCTVNVTLVHLLHYFLSIFVITVSAPTSTIWIIGQTFFSVSVVSVFCILISDSAVTQIIPFLTTTVYLPTIIDTSCHVGSDTDAILNLRRSCAQLAYAVLGIKLFLVVAILPTFFSARTPLKNRTLL